MFLSNRPEISPTINFSHGTLNYLSKFYHNQSINERVSASQEKKDKKKTSHIDGKKDCFLHKFLMDLVTTILKGQNSDKPKETDLLRFYVSFIKISLNNQ